MIQSIEDFKEWVAGDRNCTDEYLNRRFYKDTQCGGWVKPINGAALLRDKVLAEHNRIIPLCTAAWEDPASHLIPEELVGLDESWYTEFEEKGWPAILFHPFTAKVREVAPDFLLDINYKPDEIAGIQYGTIVEGSDAEFSDIVYFPIGESDWTAMVANLESFAEEEWEKANGHEDQ